MSYGPIVANIAARTLAYTVDNQQVDHLASISQDDDQPAFAGQPPPLAKRSTERLLREIALSQVRPFPVIQRTGSGVLSPRLTRVVIQVAYDGLLLIAFRGWIEDAVARVLAERISKALWRHRYVVQHPDPFGPNNIDGLGTPLPSGIASATCCGWDSAALRARLTLIDPVVRSRH